MKNTIRKKVITLFLAVIILVTTIASAQSNCVYAATRYVTRNQFITMVMKELGFTVDDTSKFPYMEAAIRAGIISERTFDSDYTEYLTKSDAAIILVNADEYLYGKTINDEFLELVLNERISDISKVSDARKDYIAKAYSLGFITGYSDGVYTRTRTIKAWQKISVDTAKKLVSMLSDKTKRAKLTDDGQLIRTTNLPEFAKYYPYILASFPNDYYDWEFQFMKLYSSKTNKPMFGTDALVNLEDYAAPIDFTKFNNGAMTWYNYNSRYKITSLALLDLCADKWQKNAEQYLNLVFNVDYRTLADDKDWYQGVLETDWQYDGKIINRERMDKYISAAVKNKTIVESSLIGVDRSSIYTSSSAIYIRAYVRYRIISCDDTDRVSLSPIIYTAYPYPNIDNIELGKWRDCYVDIAVMANQENCGVQQAVINDYFHDHPVVVAE